MGLLDLKTLAGDFLERRPGAGIFASATGSVASVLAYLNQISVVLGFFSALFGCAVGYVTLRVQWRRWKAIKNGTHNE